MDEIKLPSVEKILPFDDISFLSDKVVLSLDKNISLTKGQPEVIFYQPEVIFYQPEVIFCQPEAIFLHQEAFEGYQSTIG